MSHIQNQKFIENLLETAEEMLAEGRVDEFDSLAACAEDHGIDLKGAFASKELLQQDQDYRELQGWNVKSRV